MSTRSESVTTERTPFGLASRATVIMRWMKMMKRSPVSVWHQQTESSRNSVQISDSPQTGEPDGEGPSHGNAGLNATFEGPLG